MPTIKAFKKMNKQKTRKKKINFLFFNKYITKLNILKGGKATMYGSIGCIFSPAISCNKRELTEYEKKNYISKLMLPEEAEKEMRKVDLISKKLAIIKQKEKFVKHLPILSAYMCDKPKITESDLENVKICENVKGFENIKQYNPEMFRHFKMLNMINSGDDLFEYKKKLNLNINKHSNDFLKKLTALVECIFTLNNYGIFHCDLKIENITYNTNEDCLSIIDFGRSLIVDDESKTVDILNDIAFDFNILPQILFFHSDLPLIDNEINMREILIKKINNSINGELMLKELASIFSVKEKKIIKILSKMLFNVYTNNELHDAKNLNNYFHQIFKWNLDIWSMFLVLNNLYSNTDHSKKVKSIVKNFFELSLVKRIDHEKIKEMFESLLM